MKKLQNTSIDKLYFEFPDSDSVLIVAVEEMDQIIGDMICAGSVSISSIFHDWVAEKLTKTIEERVLSAYQSERFSDTFRLGSSRSVIALWVRYWTCSEIKIKFGEYAHLCPCVKPNKAKFND